MAKTAERSHETDEIEQVRRELEALPAGTTLNWDEIEAYVRRLGIRMPDGWTSADDIRELRGPLPDEEPPSRK
jgi:hypothetical protein